MTATSTNSKTVKIDATGIYYRELNQQLRRLAEEGVEQVELENVCGQRYIATDLSRPMEFKITGTPGNDLGAFMNGSRIEVFGNAQDCMGNTMNAGEIIIHGHAGDICGMAARGGKIFVRDYVGYRAGIHMKEYQDKKSVMVIGGTGQDFLGEYMAGGVLVVLGLSLAEGEKHRANFIGTGIHAGVIYICGGFEPHQLGKEVGVAELDDHDQEVLGGLIDEYCGHFGGNAEAIKARPFKKLYPKELRPYGRMYSY
ncbi:glutamate synthase alpha subunit domain protein [Dehalogenimonas lykanthroporepellens BL-DC-9]|nr:glutamate synthase alpha subunit domain protein [Dehalogenimonas lykanthroporepellens BL-DC-9]